MRSYCSSRCFATETRQYLNELAARKGVWPIIPTPSGSDCEINRLSFVTHGWPCFEGIQLMSSEVPIEIGDKPTAVSIMRELVERLQDTIEALKLAIARNPKSDEYRKALKGTGERLTIAKQILAREEARASHSP